MMDESLPSEPSPWSDEALVALHKRCTAFALRRVSLEDAQDFASWALIAVMSGRHPEGYRPKVDWLWVDWHRSQVGRRDSSNFALRSNLRSGDSLDAPLPDSDTLGHEVFAAPGPEDDEGRAEQVRVTQLALIGLPRREQRIAGMLLDGYQQSEIASVLGVSQPAVSVALREYRLRVARLAVQALKARAPENAAVDTRLRVQWVTM